MYYNDIIWKWLLQSIFNSIFMYYFGSFEICCIKMKILKFGKGPFNFSWFLNPQTNPLLHNPWCWLWMVPNFLQLYLCNLLKNTAACQFHTIQNINTLQTNNFAFKNAFGFCCLFWCNFPCILSPLKKGSWICIKVQTF